MPEAEEYHDKDPTKNVRELVKAEIEQLDDLATEREKTWQAKIDAIYDKLNGAESQRLENKKDSKEAVDAALAAAKELVSSQATTAKEAMEQQAATSTAALKGISDALNDLKDRVGAIENVKLGSESHKTDQRQSVGMIVGIVGALLALVMAVIAATAINGGA